MVKTKGPVFDFDKIPQTFKDDLAAATLSAVKKFMAEPGGKEYLDKKIQQKKERSNNETRKNIAVACS